MILMINHLKKKTCWTVEYYILFSFTQVPNFGIGVVLNNGDDFATFGKPEWKNFIEFCKYVLIFDTHISTGLIDNRWWYLDWIWEGHLTRFTTLWNMILWMILLHRLKRFVKLLSARLQIIAFFSYLCFT